MTSRNVSVAAMAFVFAVGMLAVPEVGRAGVYPGNKCVSSKMKAAGKYCKGVLKAWSVWDRTQDDDKRDTLLNRADAKLDDQWAKAEAKAAKKGVDCGDTTLSALELGLMAGSTAELIKDTINNDLDLNDNDDAKCGSKLLKAASKKCAAFLKAESKYIKRLAKDPEGADRDQDQQDASEAFDDKWADIGCMAGTTGEFIEGLIDDFNDDVVTNTTISPNVSDDQFDAHTHPASGSGHFVPYEGDVLGPKCQDSSEYTFFAKRGSENKLLVYYYGGGACWNMLTCFFQTCTQDVGSTPPGLAGSGFGDLTNPDNPFKDWHVLHVPYCGCDIHLGDNAVDYEGFNLTKHVEHRGYDNAKLVEKFAREHFLNPTDIFVTGSSAGSYGAMVHGVHLSAAYPAASINVMGDGGNGVATQEFMSTNFSNWGAMLNLPDVPGIPEEPDDISIPAILTAAASFYPLTNWSNYSTAFDGGGGGQTGFYNVMLNPGFLLDAQTNWHEASCEWNEIMRQQAIDTEAAVALENDNYRYYIASGSRHTGFGTPRVYDDTTGGVPTLLSWVNAMINDAPGWVNVEASPYNVLFPGACNEASDNTGAVCNVNADCPNGSCSGDDVKPDPLQAPFEWDGPDVIVNCP